MTYRPAIIDCLRAAAQAPLRSPRSNGDYINVGDARFSPITVGDALDAGLLERVSVAGTQTYHITDAGYRVLGEVGDA